MCGKGVKQIGIDEVQFLDSLWNGNKPEDNIVFGTDLNKFRKDKAEYTRKQGSLFNKEFYDIFDCILKEN